MPLNDGAPTSFHAHCPEPHPRRLLRWVYRHWQGGFYPADLPQKRWFERYAEEFDTVEINARMLKTTVRQTQS